ncbi:MAG: hypothetical protein IPM64_04115 [Phycisphaerales bacterium]|nr:hypothetical protein [Phycisphaerales bacterium]
MWMWIAGIAGSLVVAVVVLPALIGFFLPARFSGEVRIRLKRSPQEVFALLNDPQRVAFGGSMSRGIEALPAEGGLPCWRENLGSDTVIVRTVESTAPLRLVREARSEAVPMSMRCTYELSEQNGETVLRSLGEGEVRSGTWHVPYFRFMIHVFGGATMGQREYLRGIARALGDADARVE